RERLLASQLYRLRLDRRSEEAQRWAKGCPGLFAGAACYQPVELQYYKAAPLQALGMYQLHLANARIEDENEDDDQDENDPRSDAPPPSIKDH
ncbi:MAG TPA: hypothetical protein VIH58_00660, partial [Chthoniobacterales bacterium]